MSSYNESHLKHKNIDIRLLFIGPKNSKKKHIIDRFKTVNCTNTIEYDTDSENSPIFTKIFDLINCSLEFSFYLLPEVVEQTKEIKDDSDSESSSENDSNQNNFKNNINIVTIKDILIQIDNYIEKESKEENYKIEIIFCLCFDLSDSLSSFQELKKYFTYINSNFNLIDNFYTILIGNNSDKRSRFDTNEQSEIDKFIKITGFKYYEISTLYYFNFTNLFLKIFYDTFGIKLFYQMQSFEATFNNILNNKNFKKKKLKNKSMELETNKKYDNIGPGYYNNNPYDYPTDKNDLEKLFEGNKKYCSNLFINKTGPLLKQNQNKIINKKEIIKSTDNKYNLQKIMEKKVKMGKIGNYLKLRHQKNSFSFGLKSKGNIELKNYRKKMKMNNNLIIESALNFNGNIKLFKKSIPKNKSAQNIKNYSRSREKYLTKKINNIKIYEKNSQKRHNSAKLKSDQELKQKILNIKQKIDKNENKLEEKQKISYQKKQIHTSIKKIPHAPEPLAKLYPAVSSFSTNKGFTFGHKIFQKEKSYSGEPVKFLDDFDKIVIKNKFRPYISPVIKKIPKNNMSNIQTENFMKDLNEKYLKYEKNREKYKIKTVQNFINKRKNIFNIIQENNNVIKMNREKELDRVNSEINEIIFNQVEFNFPKYSFTKEKYDRNKEIFKKNKKIENEEIETQRILTTFVKPMNPSFSFATAKRFNYSKKN